MPGGEHIRLGGFDGIVECSTGNEYVPKGRSGWELSTEKKVTTKANGDLENRTKNPGHLQMSDVTFVFATPRKWPGARKWVSGKSPTSWKNVRAVWSSHLERWFEKAPWIAAHFLESIGKGRGDLQSFEMIWSSYTHTLGSNELSPDFVIRNRTEVAGRLTKWIVNEDGNEAPKVIVAGGSEREVLHYLVACIRNEPKIDLKSLESRIFAVRSEDAARSLGSLNTSHIVLVPSGPSVSHVVEVHKRTGCRIIVVDTIAPGTSVLPVPQIECLRLQPVPQGDWIRALVTVGFNADEAAKLCQDSGCDYDCLRRAALKC
jgi:hypothetical protein